MSPKRRASVSGLDESPKKFWKSRKDTRTQCDTLDEGLILQADEYISDAGLMQDTDLQDTDQPDVFEAAIRNARMQEHLQPGNEVTGRPARSGQKAAERADRWEELVFIVFAKDNFQQDPSAPAGHSTTSGPLTNAQLRDAYCNRFNKEVGAEAAMKRYRNDKQKVYDAYPNHPRNISYAPKQNKSKRFRRKKINKVETDNEEAVNSPGATVGNEPNDAEEFTAHEKSHQNMVEAIREAKKPQNTDIPQITQELRRNIEAGDVHRYVESSWAIAEHEHRPWVRIMLADSCERFIGACYIGTEDFKSSQAYVELRQHTNVRELWLTGVSRITLQRYVQCLSPLRLSKLPQCDFTLRPRGSDPVAAVATCERIVWNFEATLDIYELATQLRDCHVRNLVMDHWREQLQVNRTYETGLVEMQLMYDRLSTDDPALQFWTQALQGLLPTDDTGMDIDFVESPSSTAFFVANRRETVSDETFHYQYHRCRLSDHKDGMCDHLQHTYGNHTEASYSFEDFNHIARRLLMSEGWQEQDERVKNAGMKLELELFNLQCDLDEGIFRVKFLHKSLNAS
ncbi:hypothetical protein P171DRAFT_486752 [Karstenula rhodostoma CBS 690.94]|uniref:Uncharacterized protein n=1 Tax=Karstenula rhodostoma CBS 690.94 TaxID=1392251 RepID=A0A9P4PGK7_9PLEO|nr:hypothetical protein P171DRAFT_486752 [Karstenula rhodostoma CBS 690.94]